jgi:lactate dehydrogenase-like 2-hydroxyacid dehydrogenase
VTDRPTVLLAAPMDASLVQRLRERYEVVGPVPPPFASSLADVDADVLQRVRAVLSIGLVRIGAQEITAMPRLGLIACFGSGYEGVDVAAAREHGIVLAHGAGANAASVADLAIALMLETVREIPAARARLYAGTWKGNDRARPAPPRGVTGRRLGVFGLGSIGLKIALRAAAMEMDIGYHNRHARSDVSYAFFPTLAGLAEWADVLMIAVRADESNRHAVNRPILTALGKDGVVVNISRGSVIDQDALIDCLARRSIAGAGLDVYENEPSVPATLLALPNVALTPHVGGLTLEAREAMEGLALANIDAYFAGRPVPGPIP